MSRPRAPAAPWVARLAHGRVWLESEGGRSEGLLASTPVTSVLFDGVLYNRGELARKLSMESHGSDAELVALGYERWGEDLLPGLRGEFALAVSDARHGVALLARDPMGVYPLYYAGIGDSVVFATAVAPLLEQALVSRDASVIALAEFLWQRLPFLDETCFESVRRVPPGHVLRLQERGASASRYWAPQREHAADGNALEEFSFLVEQGVQRATQNQRAGILLSGGTDSATVAAAAACVSRAAVDAARPLAVSLDAPAAPYREGGHQRYLAEALSLPLVTRRFEELVETDAVRFGGLEWARQLSRPLGEPLIGVHVELLEAARGAGAGVVLTGHGGDEWLGLSPYFAADCIRRLDVLDLYRFWQARRGWYGNSAIRSTLWTVGIRPLLRPLRRRRSPAGLPSWLGPDPALAAALRERDEQRRRDRPASVPQARAATLDDPLTALVHENHFEESLLLEIPVRSPLLDADLVAFLHGMPPAVLLTGQRVKGLARAYLASRLEPQELPSFRQVSAPGVWDAFVDRGLEQLASRVGSLGGLVAAGVLDSRFGGLIAEPRALLQELGPVGVWRLFSAEIWLRSWG